MSLNVKENSEKWRIRSFAIRSGRMTAGQQSAYDALWENKGLQLANGLIDQTRVFGREAPLVLEIGFGMGQSLLAMAKAAPEKNFIGVEVHLPGIGKLLHGMDEMQIDNLRVFHNDVVDVLAHGIPDHSLDRIQIYFPDPWHKRKHNKRRLIQPAFIQSLRKKLKTGGVIHLATDWEDYARHMMKVMTPAEGFSNQAGDNEYSLRPEFRPITKFEKRGERLGHGVWDLLFEKIN
jgi:tRNA (guanine-N7-)-methyltransferase